MTIKIGVFISKKKIALYILGITFLAGIVGIAYMIHSFPSVYDIKQAIKKKEVVEFNEVQAPSASTINKSEEVDKNVDLKSVKENKPKNSDKAIEGVKTFLAEDLKDVRVCEYLGQTNILDSNEKEFSFEELMGDELREDSYLEAMRFTLKTVFQDENIKPLLEEVLELEKKNLAEDEQDSFLKKVGFYSRVTAAGINLYNKRSYFESVADQALHLGVLTKMAKLKPEIMQDPDLMEQCQQMEDVMKGEENINVKDEREKLIKFISKYGFKNEDLDFDPKSFIKFNIQSSEKGLNFTMKEKIE